MGRTLKFVGALVVHTLSAVIGTAVLEAEIWRLFPSHSIAGVLWKEWLLGLAFSGIIGFVMRRTLSSAATWAWLLPGVWFFLGLIFLHAPNSSAFSDGSLWSRLSGIACNNKSSVGCRSFFAFTVPLIRGVSYSLGAYMSSLAGKIKPQPVEPRLS